ncbi:competence protein TfoX [Agrobacterium vitis]|uniref:Competence protein TfoX n=1 Tax=Agrobacterium vitis TaxID=373 RepID=A0ABD6G6B8_AGRVI|nr:TfoX/Sxy family protein [Agrobacterium vitis]MUO77554.1 competence protein TfoX [Agrobacterium vitis]MUO93071.1 competence protein TfoX [Agrobacterium vitis]MUP04422.1 competence protein TfoX [Agrobacterium vitis]MUZ81138.1 competence protein TfoX [Agrobacterium vitis]MVA08676.1 competence protein TfoX [Agrobacterium vitis]
MDNADIEEMFQSLGPVSIRRMFGGKGIYHHGVIFALYLFDEIMLKADIQTAPEFAAAGARQWVYQRPGKKPVAMPYWSVPEDAFDDPDEMARWARLAYEAAVRAQKPETPKKSAKKRKNDLGEGR